MRSIGPTHHPVKPYGDDVVGQKSKRRLGCWWGLSTGVSWVKHPHPHPLSASPISIPIPYLHLHPHPLSGAAQPPAAPRFLPPPRSISGDPPAPPAAALRLQGPLRSARRQHCPPSAAARPVPGQPAAHPRGAGGSWSPRAPAEPRLPGDGRRVDPCQAKTPHSTR